MIKNHGKLSTSKIYNYESRMLDKVNIKLAGSQEAPKDICKAREQGTRKAMDNLKELLLVGCNKVKID